MAGQKYDLDFVYSCGGNGSVPVESIVPHRKIHAGGYGAAVYQPVDHNRGLFCIYKKTAAAAHEAKACRLYAEMNKEQIGQ